MNSSLKISLAIIAGGIIIAVAVYVSMPKKSDTSAGNPALVRPVGIVDHILGNPAAPIMIIEYSDFDCDYCKNLHNTLNQIIANEGAGGSVAWIFRNFPLSEIHPNAFSHARAAECAAKTSGNDAFWRFSNELFAGQPIDPSRYGETASLAGISGDGFATCYSKPSPDLDGRINADRQNALDMGADGTPYSIILMNGKPFGVMIGAYSYDAVRQIIDNALNK
jgi:protein-disulfide isomerase